MRPSALARNSPDQLSKPGERWIGIGSRSSIEPLRTAHPEVGEIVVFGCVLPWGGSQWRAYLQSLAESACRNYEIEAGSREVPREGNIPRQTVHSKIKTSRYFGSKSRSTRGCRPFPITGIISEVGFAPNGRLARHLGEGESTGKILIETLRNGEVWQRYPE